MALPQTVLGRKIQILETPQHKGLRWRRNKRSLFLHSQKSGKGMARAGEIDNLSHCQSKGIMGIGCTHVSPLKCPNAIFRSSVTRLQFRKGKELDHGHGGLKTLKSYKDGNSKKAQNTSALCTVPASELCLWAVQLWLTNRPPSQP